MPQLVLNTDNTNRGICFAEPNSQQIFFPASMSLSLSTLAARTSSQQQKTIQFARLPCDKFGREAEVGWSFWNWNCTKWTKQKLRTPPWWNTGAHKHRKQEKLKPVSCGSSSEVSLPTLKSTSLDAIHCDVFCRLQMGHLARDPDSCNVMWRFLRVGKTLAHICHSCRKTTLTNKSKDWGWRRMTNGLNWLWTLYSRSRNKPNISQCGYRMIPPLSVLPIPHFGLVSPNYVAPANLVMVLLLLQLDWPGEWFQHGSDLFFVSIGVPLHGIQGDVEINSDTIAALWFRHTHTHTRIHESTDGFCSCCFCQSLFDCPVDRQPQFENQAELRPRTKDSKIVGYREHFGQNNVWRCSQDSKQPNSGSFYVNGPTFIIDPSHSCFYWTVQMSKPVFPKCKQILSFEARVFHVWKELCTSFCRRQARFSASRPCCQNRITWVSCDHGWHLAQMFYWKDSTITTTKTVTFCLLKRRGLEMARVSTGESRTSWVRSPKKIGWEKNHTTCTPFKNPANIALCLLSKIP